MKTRTYDDTDIRIAHELGRDGRLSNRALARRLGMSEGGVRLRLGRLRREGSLRVVAQVNLESAPEGFLAIVGLKIDGRQLDACAHRIRALPAVLTTMIVTGRHDLMALLYAASHQTLVDFITHDLATIPGVRDSETTVVLRAYGQWLDPERVFSDHARPAAKERKK